MHSKHKFLDHFLVPLVSTLYSVRASFVNSEKLVLRCTLSHDVVEVIAILPTLGDQQLL
jgi:hypothetical protein